VCAVSEQSDADEEEVEEGQDEEKDEEHVERGGSRTPAVVENVVDEAVVGVVSESAPETSADARLPVVGKTTACVVDGREDWRERECVCECDRRGRPSRLTHVANGVHFDCPEMQQSQRCAEEQEIEHVGDKGDRMADEWRQVRDVDRRGRQRWTHVEMLMPSRDAPACVAESEVGLLSGKHVQGCSE
jgi:hypothetical protein